ncbi:MAG: L,D-transpeptidase [Candidatus Nanoarchaeia archaeon]|nr:L,D-transpeptidase [Candidatus Nanoarchaeia archaeon]MDD5588322.1 L,D-transpeptidase [Candidatus Nanoarchaeia archaeon]
MKRRNFIECLALVGSSCLMPKQVLKENKNICKPDDGIVDISFSTLELEELIKKDYKREFNNKDKNIIKDINLRNFLRDKITEQNNSYLFGKCLDDAVSNFIIRFNKLYSQIRNSCYEPLQDGNLDYALVMPKSFLEDEMDISIEIDKKDLLLKVYQNFNSQNLLLLEKPVALGKGKTIVKDKEMNFNTPSGTFYIKRIVTYPWWYPPEWSDAKGPIKPGKNNPYGIWMAETCSNLEIEGYEINLKGDDGIRIHSTNMPLSIGKYASHGCIRVHPDVAEELFPAILYYIYHKEPKTNSRGTIYPLEKVIEVRIE